MVPKDFSSLFPQTERAAANCHLRQPRWLYGSVLVLRVGFFFDPSLCKEGGTHSRLLLVGGQLNRCGEFLAEDVLQELVLSDAVSRCDDDIATIGGFHAQIGVHGIVRGGEDGLSLVVFDPGDSAVLAIRHGLLLTAACDGIEGNQTASRVIEEPTGIVFVHNCTSRPHGAVTVGLQCNRLSFPVNQIGTGDVSLILDIPGKFSIGVILIKDVVFALIIDQSVGIVQPILFGRDVILRAVLFLIIACHILCFLRWQKERGLFFMICFPDAGLVSREDSVSLYLSLPEGGERVKKTPPKTIVLPSST